MTSLYLHIPFCEKKCFYCSFVVAIAQDQWIDSYLDCLNQEARPYQGELVDTVYLGGGTPTYLSLEQLERLFSMIRRNFQLTPECEFTIEANPEGMDPVRAKLLIALGVNRISLGIQSLNDCYLKYLGRCHDAQLARNAFDNLRKAGFKNINVDLMYSFPGETEKEIEDDVIAIKALNSDHLSLYTLTIEENSKFYASKVVLDHGENRARQYEFVIGLLEKSDFKQYEISNFAKIGKESRHNLNYWRGGNYIGLGIGAHSHINGQRFWNVGKLNLYLSKIEKGEDPTEGREQLTLEQQLIETMLVGLRMSQGVSVGELEKKTGKNIGKDRKVKINGFIQAGLLKWDHDRLIATSQGRLMLDEICSHLI